MEKQETHQAELRVTPEEARSIASLLRYAISLNTTAGLVFPTQRRLATSTYRAVELAALVLEGKALDEAIQESEQTWTGSLAKDHLRAIELLVTERDALRHAMAGHLTPEQLADYLEIAQDQFLELVRPNAAKRRDIDSPEG
ncbi:MAG TPA: hypothetical protein VGP38_11560 [Rubrobacter sp.]|nr:hypothetical protein [Rubrobacter sp.]